MVHRKKIVFIKREGYNKLKMGNSDKEHMGILATFESLKSCKINI